MMNARILQISGVFVVAGALLAGCATAPKTTAERDTLKNDAQRSLAEMESRDPSLQPTLSDAAGYVVFPDVSQGGAVIGGAGGRGVVYQKGQFAGYADLSEVSMGAELGGQRFTEVIVLKDPQALARLKQGTFDMGGQASAVIVKEGAGTGAQFKNGVAVFIHPKGGAMVNASVSGQRIRFSM
jgi:lipid-binding SYLF domain-containing protein